MSFYVGKSTEFYYGNKWDYFLCLFVCLFSLSTFINLTCHETSLPAILPSVGVGGEGNSGGVGTFGISKTKQTIIPLLSFVLRFSFLSFVLGVVKQVKAKAF
jgi:hypothetical protein